MNVWNSELCDGEEETIELGTTLDKLTELKCTKKQKHVVRNNCSL